MIAAMTKILIVSVPLLPPCRRNTGWRMWQDQNRRAADSMVGRPFCGRPAVSASVSRHMQRLRLEHDHLPHRLPLAKAIEPKIDLVEPEPPAHQPVYGQPAAAIQLDVAGQVARRHASADIAALNRPLFRNEIYLRQR